MSPRHAVTNVRGQYRLAVVGYETVSFSRCTDQKHCQARRPASDRTGGDVGAPLYRGVIRVATKGDSVDHACWATFSADDRNGLNTSNRAASSPIVRRFGWQQPT
jgi:hypothetical protein